MNISNPFPVDDDLPMAEPVGVAQRPGVALVRSAAPTFGTYLSIVRERKWLVLGTAAVVTVLATVAVNLMTPIYQASTTILIWPYEWLAGLVHVCLRCEASEREQGQQTGSMRLDRRAHV